MVVPLPFCPQVYPDPVRVVAIGKSVEQLLSAPAADDNMQSSVEFCGGTHLTNTAQVGLRVGLAVWCKAHAPGRTLSSHSPH